MQDNNHEPENKETASWFKKHKTLTLVLIVIAVVIATAAGIKHADDNTKYNERNSRATSLTQKIVFA